ncbi:hypothetical protein PLICRDRAFT_694151 [Plicaturopsis crispa FD-325 SS-3]|nr:hypothetical protein PLICRDRAFT_694151 [Plicaturopsis crispa FD-325 SS-3]
MSSWPPPPPYPPSSRRSPSRSPSRGPYAAPPAARPAYPDAPYPQDPYRADWDAYERDRAWASYERERAAYEYSRRGRSRSPPLADDTGRKRRRSPSPYERGRYDPRPRYPDDYDAHSRGYGYASPRRGQYPPSHQAARRPPQDPRALDYIVSLKQYAEWFRFSYPSQAAEEDAADKAAEQEAGDGSKPRNGIKSRWEKYKKDFAVGQLNMMFNHHRKSPWFAEKYDPAPEYVHLRARVRKEGWKGREEAFLADVETGKYDPDLAEPEPEPTSPVKENPSTNGESSALDAASKDAASGEEPKASGGGDDEMQFNVDAEDEPGDNDTSRVETNGKAGGDNNADNNVDNSGPDNRRFSRGEEISVQPEGNQVMIRTIPPDIGRLKLEDACGKVPGFIYLALGDPLQKRNFYRAGWLRFADDADMPAVVAELSEKKIEGFKLHVTQNIRPFTNRVRYAPEVASKPDRLAKDLENAKTLARLLEDQASALRKTKRQPPPAPESDVKPEGENGEPVVKDEQPDVDMADGANLPVEEDDPEPSERGSVAVERRIEKIMADLVEQGLVDVNDDKALNAKKTVVSLDLYLAYLRAAFHTCYYCAIVTDHLEELQRKCLKHVRKPMSKTLLEEVKAAEKEKEEREKIKVDDDEAPQVKEKPAETRDWKRNDERWLDWLDSKIALLINRDGVDPRDYGGKSYDDELTKAVEYHIKQEDEGKFRCKTCQKLFKATSFVEKHIANKHPELVTHLDELPYFNNFALDPHRIQPFAHPPPPVGNSQGPPPEAYGLVGPHYPGGGDYNRGGAYYGGGGGGYQQGYPPPPYANGAYWDPHAYQYGAPGAYPPPPASRRDEAITARRLSDRISGYAPGFEGPGELPIPAAAGLPAKPVATLEPGPGGRRPGSGRLGGALGGGPPPPPPDAKEDPRAAIGKRVSYHDMDQVAEGDVELPY